MTWSNFWLHKLSRMRLIAKAVLEHLWFYVGMGPFVFQTLTARYKPAALRHARILYCPDKKHRLLDLYCPANHMEGPHPVFVFIYGGAWGSGDRAYYTLLGFQLAKEGIVVIIPNYATYPKGYVDEMVQDTAMVLQWTKE